VKWLVARLSQNWHFMPHLYAETRMRGPSLAQGVALV